MAFDPTIYVPILQARTAEFGALSDIPSRRSLFVVILEVPPLTYEQSEDVFPYGNLQEYRARDLQTLRCADLNQVRFFVGFQ